MDQAQSIRTVEAQPDQVLPLIQLVSDLIMKRCDRFLITRYGLTTAQYQLLVAALHNSDVTLGELSEHLNCSRGNVTGIVDRLERDEWLKRERSTRDRRVITVKLTEKGKTIGSVRKELEAELATLSQVWDTQQREQVASLLSRMYRELKE